MTTYALLPIRETLALAAVAAAAAVCTAGALADTVTVANFEGGMPAGWTATPNGWTFGGTTGTSPNIFPAQGARFARCGAPNTASETLVGTLTSPPLVVLSRTLTWRTCGWSGQLGTDANRFEILNANMDVVATRTPAGERIGLGRWFRGLPGHSILSEDG